MVANVVAPAITSVRSVELFLNLKIFQHVTHSFISFFFRAPLALCETDQACAAVFCIPGVRPLPSSPVPPQEQRIL